MFAPLLEGFGNYNMLELVADILELMIPSKASPSSEQLVAVGYAERTQSVIRQ
jgi:hypothetical protein